MIYFEHSFVDGEIEITCSDVKSLKKKKRSAYDNCFCSEDILDDDVFLRDLDYRERAKGLN